MQDPNVQLIVEKLEQVIKTITHNGELAWPILTQQLANQAWVGLCIGVFFLLLAVIFIILTFILGKKGNERDSEFLIGFSITSFIAFIIVFIIGTTLVYNEATTIVAPDLKLVERILK